MTEKDPLVFPDAHFTADSRVKVMALIPASVLEHLRTARAIRTISPQNTAELVGDLVAEALARIPGLRPLAVPRETPSTGIVRRAVASFLLEGVDSPTAPMVGHRSGLSQPTVALALRVLNVAGMVDKIYSTASVRPMWGHKLTLAGILATSKDQAMPEAERFTLGGMLPEGLDPVAPEPAPAIPEALSPGGAQANFWKQALARVAKSAESNEDPDVD